MSRKSRRGAVKLPKGVHRIVARSRDYYYFQTARGTPQQGPRIPLPNDTQSPEFWNAIRQAQGIVGPVPTDTINALADAYEAAWPRLPRKLALRPRNSIGARFAWSAPHGATCVRRACDRRMSRP